MGDTGMDELLVVTEEPNVLDGIKKNPLEERLVVKADMLALGTRLSDGRSKVFDWAVEEPDVVTNALEDANVVLVATTSELAKVVEELKST